MQLPVRIIQGVLTLVLLVHGVRHIVGMESWDSSNNLLAVNLGFGTLPALGNTGWDRFFMNILTGVGVGYCLSAITGDVALARNLAIMRISLGVLNLYSVASGSLSTPFLLFGLIEVVTAGVVLATTSKPAAISGKKKK